MALNPPDVPNGEATKEVFLGLDEFILVEILCRLPSTKHVFQCKCVSKQWNSLISDHYFIDRFIDHHCKSYGTNFNTNKLRLFYNGSAEECGSINKRPYRIESSFNDLLVCCDMRSITYCIANSFTNEHIELPSHDPGISCLKPRRFDQVGFVCEPFYAHRGRQSDLNPNYRYRVVGIMDYFRNFLLHFNIKIYCSETRQWSVLTGLEKLSYGCGSNVVAHGGKLYWYNFEKRVVVYDPFSEVSQPCFDSLSFDISPNSYSCIRLAESQGSLFLIEIKEQELHGLVSIWKLKEERGNGEGFHFEREVMINHITSKRTPSFIRQLVDDVRLPRVLGVHSSKPDVIFLGYPKCGFVTFVVSFNLSSMELRMVGELQWTYDIHYPPHRLSVVQASLPWWPTPVH